MKQRSFFLCGNNAAITKMMVNAGWKAAVNIPTADLLVFGGGADVSPELYGEKPLATTKSDRKRDDYESKIFDIGIEDEKKMVGICRGGQLLNVLSGGALWQFVDRHNSRYHSVTTIDGTILGVNSFHKQMMRPHHSGKLLAYSFESIRKNGAFVSSYDINIGIPEPEVVYYPTTNCLCFQPHPEEEDKTQTREYFFDLLNDFMEDRI